MQSAAGANSLGSTHVVPRGIAIDTPIIAIDTSAKFFLC
jgi:hypothetical protein